LIVEALADAIVDGTKRARGQERMPFVDFKGPPPGVDEFCQGIIHVLFRLDQPRAAAIILNP